MATLAPRAWINVEWKKLDTRETMSVTLPTLSSEGGKTSVCLGRSRRKLPWEGRCNSDASEVLCVFPMHTQGSWDSDSSA